MSETFSPEVIERNRRNVGFGARPASPREAELVNEVLKSGQLFDYVFTRQFEEAVARVHEKRIAIFVNSGTSALDLAVHSLKRLRGWQDGDEVLIPAVTFVASLTPLIRMGLKPVFVDIDPEHFDLDVSQLERHITGRTRGIMAVHLLGQICQMEEVMEAAGAHRLGVIEDACETMFVRRNGRVSGSWGDMVCFSTFMVHMISTAIGGFVATDDVELAEKAKQLANHANSSYKVKFDDDGLPVWDSSYNRTTGRPRSSTGETYDDVGYSFRASELEAAIGVAQMERWEDILAGFQRNGERLNENLADLGERLQLPKPRAGNEHGYFRYGMVIKDPAIDREDFARFLNQHGISATRIFPLINQPIYREMYGDLERDYPGAALVNRNGLMVSCHDGLTFDDMDFTSEVIHDYFAQH